MPAEEHKVDPLFVAQTAPESGSRPQYILPALANRHGCITGATGTGKTVSLQVLAEQFSRIGVPVFMADVKGDLTGISQNAQMTDKLRKRLAANGMPEPAFGACPATLWDVFGEQGHPVRATISAMGPTLLAPLLGLNETQEGVLNVVFKYADDQGLLLLDLKDLQAMLAFTAEHASELRVQYGNISAASVGAIQRALLRLQNQGAEKFFGEPMLNIDDMLQTIDGQGVVNILAADKLVANPMLYSVFLLWLLSEIYEAMPEAGDCDRPKLVFFFDEAHLLFNNMPRELLDKIVQV
ncbi:MAG: DUF853 family protein, partial [Duodenibacillus sp.]|nr:DUF853 family protein [Duodenibacillus sp.]